MFFKERKIPLLKRPSLVMLGLVANIGKDCMHLCLANGKCTVSSLPCKLPLRGISGLDPERRSSNRMRSCVLENGMAFSTRRAFNSFSAHCWEWKQTASKFGDFLARISRDAVAKSASDLTALSSARGFIEGDARRKDLRDEGIP